MKILFFCPRSLPIYFWLFILLFLFLPIERSSAQQQGIPSEGKEFYIGYVWPSFNKNPNNSAGRNVSGFFSVEALISSFEDNNIVKISYFDPVTGAEIPSITKIVTAHNAVEVPLNQYAMKCDEPGEKAQYRACHITSKKPINVQYFSTGANSGGSYLALPTIALGKNYVVASYHDNPKQGALTHDSAENAGGFFMIIAPYENTKVSYVPNGVTAKGHAAKQWDSVLLHRGQCYWVKGDGSNENNDLSGSIITSDKPVAVLAGHEDAFLGGVNGKFADGRNFMIQQMIPAEDFESSGFVSIPFPESGSIASDDPGYGQNYRVYAYDQNVSDIQASDIAGTSPISAFPYGTSSKEIQNTSSPMDFLSNTGKKFSVITYDLRAFGTNSPFPAPAMMTIVPMSHWRTSFLFYVPGNSFIALQNYYITLIALRTDFEKSNIKFSVNGGALQLLTALPAKGGYQNIPHHTELRGVQYAVNPGAYYFSNTRDAIHHPLSDTGIYAATSDQVTADTGLLHGAFMIYHYEFRGLDPDRDIGDFCGDDYFFECATPVGMMVSNGQGYAKPKLKVDTLCTSWHLCVSDPNGVRSVQLLDDPGGNYVRPGKQFHNVHLDPKLDPDNMGEIDFSGMDTLVCFDLFTNNPLDSAYAPLYIVNSGGVHIDPIPELFYKPAHVRLSVLPDLPARIDSLIYPTTKVGDEVCSTLVYINTSSGTSAKSLTIVSASLRKNKSQITIASTVPNLPATLKAGDTLKMQICFRPDDTLIYADSIILKTDCFDAPLPIVGQGGTALILATDIDFGDVVVGTTARKSLIVRNVGALPFTLTKNWVLHNISLFSMDPAYAALLPAVLLPGGKPLTLYFNYTPTSLGHRDSTTVDWNSDIPEPYTKQLKSWSYLKGHPFQPGVIWDRKLQYFVPDSTSGIDSVIMRVYLLNNSGTMAHVHKVFLIGATAAEFYILDDQLGKLPLGNFDMNDADMLWVDLVFKPDLTKPYPERFADRIDSLVATFYNPADPTVYDSVFMKVIGTWTKSAVKPSAALSAFSLRPNPTSGGQVILSFSMPTSEKVSFSIFDVLGREIYHDAALSNQILNAGNHEENVTLPKIEAGIYYARLSVGNEVLTQKLEIVK